jgi:hypothetical protein
MLSLVAEYFTQLGDGSSDAVVKLDDGARGPQPGAQLLPRDKLPGVFKQQRQHLERLASQADQDPVSKELPIPEVSLEQPKSKDSRWLLFCCHRCFSA